MKLEKAHSLDLKRNVTPIEADEQFQRGSIQSKFDFQCPDKNCDAQVTCANLDRQKHLRKREPYYKVVGEHSADCLIAKDIEKRPRRRRLYDIYGPEDVPIEGAYKINLQPPDTKKDQSEQAISDNGRESHVKSNSYSVDNSPRRTQPTKTLSSIVDSFLNNEEVKIQMPKIGAISIKGLFVEFNNQDITALPDEWRIYYGRAWFNKKSTGYSVSFENKLFSGEIKRRPSFYISNAALESSGFVKFNKQNMESIADGRPKLVFLMSETTPYLKAGKYINIWCDVPHFMDYRL